MKRTLLFGLLALTGCGPSTPQLEFDFKISALLADTVSALQVSIVTKGLSLGNGSCFTVQSNCLNKQVTDDRYVRVQDAMGVEKKALLFLLNLKPGSSGNSVQDVSVQGIPVGKDYAVVIEALSKDNPPNLAGSSCNYLQEVVPGMNPRKLADIIKPITPPVDCDPTVK